MSSGLLLVRIIFEEDIKIEFNERTNKINSEIMLELDEEEVESICFGSYVGRKMKIFLEM